MGKGLAEFRKASDDFKRTWEREVALEAAKLDFETDNTMLPEGDTQAFIEAKDSVEPMVQTTDPELVVARGSSEPEPLSQVAESLTPAEPLAAAAEPAAPEPLRKQEWI